MAAESDTERKPNALKGLIFLGVVALIIAVLASFVLSQRSSTGPLVVEDAPAPIPVRVAQIELRDTFELGERYTGLVEPRRQSELGFSSGGRIASISADVGDRVSAGQTLATLDTRALNAELAAARANVAEAEAAHALARNTVDRQTQLLDRGHVSVQRVDEAEAQADTAEARIAAAEARADALRVQIDLARIQAPFAGMITARMADEGAIASPGMAVLELVEDSVLEARIGLPGELAASLSPGEAYRLTTDGGEIDAILKSVTGVIARDERTVTTVFEIPSGQTVRSGAVVRLLLERELDARGAWVPVSALSESQRGLWSVYVAAREEDGWVARPGLVEIVHTEGDRAFVRGALGTGDQVILEGLQRITPGQAIAPQSQPLASRAGEG